MKMFAIPVFGLAITCGVIGYLNYLEIELIDCSKVIEKNQEYTDCLKTVANLSFGVNISIVFVLTFSGLGVFSLTLKDEMVPRSS